MAFVDISESQLRANALKQQRLDQGAQAIVGAFGSIDEAKRRERKEALEDDDRKLKRELVERQKVHDEIAFKLKGLEAGQNVDASVYRDLMSGSVSPAMPESGDPLSSGVQSPPLASNDAAAGLQQATAQKSGIDALFTPIPGFVSKQDRLKKQDELTDLSLQKTRRELDPAYQAQKERKEYQRAVDKEVRVNQAKLKYQADLDAQKPPTQDQTKDATFAKRLESAEAMLAGMPSMTGGELAQQKYIPDIFGNFRSDDVNKRTQAETNFLTGVLRKESGAAIADSEFVMGAKTYFPRPGDSEEVLAEKARNRQFAIESMRLGSGKAYEMINKNLQRSSSPQSETKVVNGVTYTKVEGGWKRAK